MLLTGTESNRVLLETTETLEITDIRWANCSATSLDGKICPERNRSSVLGGLLLCIIVSVRFALFMMSKWARRHDLPLKGVLDLIHNSKWDGVSNQNRQNHTESLEWLVRIEVREIGECSWNPVLRGSVLGGFLHFNTEVHRVSHSERIKRRKSSYRTFFNSSASKNCRLLPMMCVLLSTWVLVEKSSRCVVLKDESALAWTRRFWIDLWAFLSIFELKSHLMTLTT